MTKRKTKKEKIIASLRRQLEIQKRKDFVSYPTPGKNVASSIKLEVIDGKEEVTQPVLAKPIKPISVKEDKPDFLSVQSISLVKKDLLKSLFFSLIAIAFEFMLYWKLS